MINKRWTVFKSICRKLRRVHVISAWNWSSSSLLSLIFFHSSPLSFRLFMIAVVCAEPYNSTEEQQQWRRREGGGMHSVPETFITHYWAHENHQPAAEFARNDVKLRYPEPCWMEQHMGSPDHIYHLQLPTGKRESINCGNDIIKVYGGLLRDLKTDPYCAIKRNNYRGKSWWTTLHDHTRADNLRW